MPPDFSGLASSNFILMRSEFGLNNGFPRPRSKGVSARSSSSKRPCFNNVEERSALPKTNKGFPGSFFSLMTSSTTLSFTSLVLFQSAFFSVLENTTFGIEFMKSATSPFWVGQYEAIPSYVTRPNNSMPVDFDCSIAYCSNSSPQIVSCQSISQLFGPSNKPSSVTRFHMMSLRIPFTRFQRCHSPAPDIPAVGAARGPPSTSGPVRRRDSTASFKLSRFSDRTELMPRPVDERGDALASEPEGDSESNRAQHGGPEKGVPEPGQPELRIEPAGNGQHQGQAKREAEALGGLDQPRGEALFPGLCSGEARDGEGGESNARTERPQNRPRQDAEIARGDRQRRQHRQPQGHERRGNDQHSFEANPVHEPRGPPSADEEEDRGRGKECQTRVQGGVAKDALQIDGQHDQGSRGGAHDERQNVAGQGRPAAQEGQRHEWRLRPVFDGQEGRQGEGGEAQGQCRLHREEAVGRGNRERVYKEDQPGGNGHRAGDGEALRRRTGTVPRDETLSQDRRHGSDRHVDEHDRSPPERRGEDAARDRACREPRRQDRDEDPEGSVALLPLRERGREDRQSRGGRHGSGDALNRPRDNEGEERWRKSGRQGRYGE